MSARLEHIKQQAAGLPAQFEARAWDDFIEGPIVRSRMQAAKLDSTSTSIDRATTSAKKHFERYGNLDTWAVVTGSSSSQQIVRKHVAKMEAQKREMLRELKSSGHNGRYASAGEVLNLLTTAHDVALHEHRPSARAILREQVGERDAPRLAATKSRHVKTAMQALADHPTAKLMEAQGMRTARDVGEICKSSLAGGVAALYQRADVAKRLAAQDAALREMCARLEAAEAKLTQHDSRLESIEQGVDWRVAALHLKGEGLNAGEIARRLGQKYETVRKHLQRKA